MSLMSAKIVKNFPVILRAYINGMECAWIMKITLKLNIGNYQSIDIESDDLPTKANCYEQICRVLKDWETITDNATQLIGVFAVHIPDLEYPIEKLEVTEEVVKPKKLSRSTKKLDAVKHKISNKPCRTCGGFISWDGFDKADPTPPLHVNKDGVIIGDGSCPEWEAEQ